MQGSIQKRVGKRGVTWTVVLDLPRDPVTGKRQQRAHLCAVQARGGSPPDSYPARGPHRRLRRAHTAHGRGVPVPVGGADRGHSPPIDMCHLPWAYRADSHSGSGRAVTCKGHAAAHPELLRRGLAYPQCQDRLLASPRATPCFFSGGALAADPPEPMRGHRSPAAAAAALPRLDARAGARLSEGQPGGQLLSTVATVACHRHAERRVTCLALVRCGLGAPYSAGNTLLHEVERWMDRERAQDRGGAPPDHAPAILRAGAKGSQAASGLAGDADPPRERGQPLNRGYVRERFLKAQADLNLPPLRFHDLRHTAATIMFEYGENAKAISERPGHSSVAITLDLYGHVTQQMQQDLAARMDEALG